MRLASMLAIVAVLTLVSAAVPYSASARGGDRHDCSVSCGGGVQGKTCEDYKVSQQRCFNQCMGYEACPGVGLAAPKKKK